MAKLPSFEQLGNRSPQPASGAVSYRPVSGYEEAPGSAAAQFGETVQKIAFQQQDDLNTTKAEEAWNTYKTAALDLATGKDGFTTRRAGNAVNGDIFKTYTGTLGKARKALEENLGDADVRRKFAQRANVTDLQFKDQLLRHYTVERDAYEKQTFDGSMAAATAMVSAAPLDQPIFETAMLNAERRVEALADHQGITDKDAREKMKGAVRDTLLTARLDALVYSAPLQAEQLFRLTQDQITDPKTRLTLQHKIREASLGVNATTTAQQIMASTRSEMAGKTMYASATEDSMRVPPDVQHQRDQVRLDILKAELVDNPNDENLKRAIRDTTETLARTQPAAFHPEDPRIQNTSGLPNARDVRAQLPVMLAKVEGEANRLYGKDQQNPDRAAFVARTTSEIKGKVALDAAQLDAIQRQSQGELIDFVAGFNGGAPVTSLSQIQSDPKMYRAWQMTDPTARIGISRLVESNASGGQGNSDLYWKVFNRVHADPGSADKIDFYQQILPFAGPDKLNMRQIGQLRLEIDRNETPGGRSIGQLMRSNAARAEQYFRSHIMFTAQPDKQIAAVMRWTEDVGKKIDEYVKEGKDTRTLFQLDSKDSVISQQYLNTYVTSTAAQGLADNAAKVRQQQGAESFLKPGETLTVLDRKTADETWKALPPGAPYRDPAGNLRRKAEKVK
jgi:hypothetical protein